MAYLLCSVTRGINSTSMELYLSEDALLKRINEIRLAQLSNINENIAELNSSPKYATWTEDQKARHLTWLNRDRTVCSNLDTFTAARCGYSSTAVYQLNPDTRDKPKKLKYSDFQEMISKSTIGAQDIPTPETSDQPTEVFDIGP